MYPVHTNYIKLSVWPLLFIYTSLIFQSAIKAKLMELGAYVGKDAMFCGKSDGNHANLKSKLSVLCLNICETLWVWSIAFILTFPDDELPDYIMVMVANKRSRQQMEDDLQLFLGDSTITFTAWLHTVLSKLQQVTVNSTGLSVLTIRHWLL